MTTISERVNASTDDGEYDQSTWHNDTTEIDLRAQHDVGYWRFAMSIPQDAFIASADLTLYCSDKEDSSSSWILEASLEDVNDSSVITSLSDAQSRTRLYQKFAQNIPDGTSHGDLIAIDVAETLQQVVSRPGWSSGSHVTVFVETNAGDGSHVYTYEGSRDNAGLLTVTGHAARSHTGHAAFAVATVLDAGGVRASVGAATLGTITVLAASGDTPPNTGHATFAITAALAARGEREPVGTAGLGTATALSAAGTAPILQSATFTTATALAAHGVRMYEGDANLATGVTVHAAGVRMYEGHATFTVASAVAAEGHAGPGVGAATFTTSVSLTATGERTAEGSVEFTITSSLTAAGPRRYVTTTVGWRYHAQLLPSAEWLTHDLAISDVTMHHDLSGPSALTGHIPRGFADEVTGQLRAWGAAIYPEASGELRGGFIVTAADPQPDKLAVSCVGFAGYPAGIPFDGDYTSPDEGVDPFDVVRLIWTHVQGKAGGDLGVIVDTAQSPIRLGSMKDWLRSHPDKAASDFTQQDRYSLQWWNHTDCGQEIDKLAGEAPFDYVEYHTWAGNNVVHGVRLGYPSLGRRRHDLRFVLGENLAAIPQPSGNDDYASEVLALGAGEGSKMLRSLVARPTDRLRRVSVLAEKDVRTRRRLAADAQRLLDRNSHAETLTSIDVVEHPNAPLGGLDPGDEIRVQADLGWRDLDVWARMTSVAYKPGDGTATLTLEEL
jgi:hypothetical protein